MKRVTVIDKAKELISTVGKEEAIEQLRSVIVAIGEPKSFEDACKISGLETAIDYCMDQ